jgi:hypothetical protein
VRVVRIRDLEHIKSLAQAECARNTTGPGLFSDHANGAVKYDISGMPIEDVIEMVAGLLGQITLANDLVHDAKQRSAAIQQQAMSSDPNSLNASVLAFHGKNVPSIGIHSYLYRINKYCPTTFEIFLSLLVYFDRMTERINRLVAETEARRQQHLLASARVAVASRLAGDDDIDDIDDDDNDNNTDSTDDYIDAYQDHYEDKGARPPSQGFAANPSLSMATYFVVDNYNIHRLMIAGVTCASKFFSDVFYTNLRYARVRVSVRPFRQSHRFLLYHVNKCIREHTGWRAALP